MLAPSTRLAMGVLAFSVLWGAGPARAGDPKKDGEFNHDPLIVTLEQKAPDLVKHLLEKDLKNVGVLKFLVQRPGEALSDNVGELNLNMADWLEVALVQAAPPDRKMGQTERLRIIKKASEKIAVQRNPKYTHNTEDGRKAFFDLEYNLYWGKEKVVPDAFITGVVVFGKDRKARIQFKIFELNGKLENLFNEVELTPSMKMLTNAGYSWALAKDMLKEPDVATVVAGRDFLVPPIVEKKKPDFLLESPVAKLEKDPFRSPVRMTIRYNGVEQPIVNGTVREPNKGETVSFMIENPTEYTFAVLVRVNGLNTIFPEKQCLDPRLCHKWILKPGEKQIIDGYQSDDKSYNEFIVLSPKESKENEINYGSDVGTFQMVSFKGAVVDKDPEIDLVKSRTETDTRKIAITRGSLAFGDGAPPATLKELQGHLKDTGKLFSGSPRGLVVKGTGGGKKEVERLFFRTDVEAQNATIRYYSAKSR